MKPINLKVKTKYENYRIIIGSNIIRNLNSYLKKNSIIFNQCLLVIDKNIPNRMILKITKSLKKRKTFKFIFTANEKNKNIKYVNKILQILLDKNFSRQDCIITIGGGITGDVGGFAASLYKRGLSYINIPTTLLSQVDSSIGGKTGINTKNGKNLIGTFYQPKAVLISLNTLQSLPYRQIISGYAEILKYSLIQDNAFFFWLKKNGQKIISLDNRCLIYAIKKSCQIKSKIVSEDEKEKGIREILNLGHTFGHAIESLTGFSKKILHGEAVFLGMFLAIKFSVFLGFGQKKMIENYENHMKDLKIPFRLSEYNLKFSHKEFIKHLRFDKKVKNNKLKFILLKQYGKTLSYTLNNEKLLVKFLETNLE